MKYKPNTFTLVEMLIVIAIVAVLASLLMPALQSAMISSRIASCSNNLRQQSLGQHQYADDHNNFFMQARVKNGWPHYYNAPDSSNPKANQIDFLTDYLNVSRDDFNKGCFNTLEAKAITLGILSCPSRTPADRKVCGSSPNIDYLNNGEAWMKFNSAGRDAPIRRSRFFHPSIIFHLCDGIILENGHNETTPYLTQLKNPWYDLESTLFTHPVNCYAAFDGRVATLEKVDTWKIWTLYDKGGTGADTR